MMRYPAVKKPKTHIPSATELDHAKTTLWNTGTALTCRAQVSSLSLFGTVVGQMERRVAVEGGFICVCTRWLLPVPQEREAA
jgi:hypothetical protein